MVIETHRLPGIASIPHGYISFKQLMVIETNQQTSSGPTNTGYISFKQLMVIETDNKSGDVLLVETLLHQPFRADGH